MTRPQLTKSKRPHREYSKNFKREVLAYSNELQHKDYRLVALAYDLPESTVRGWIQKAAQKSKYVRVLQTSLALLGLTLLSVVLMVLVGMGVCWLFGGREEALYFGRVLWELLLHTLGPF